MCISASAAFHSEPTWALTYRGLSWGWPLDWWDSSPAWSRLSNNQDTTEAAVFELIFWSTTLFSIPSHWWAIKQVEDHLLSNWLYNSVNMFAANFTDFLPDTINQPMSPSPFLLQKVIFLLAIYPHQQKNREMRFYSVCQLTSKPHTMLMESMIPRWERKSVITPINSNNQRTRAFVSVLWTPSGDVRWAAGHQPTQWAGYQCEGYQRSWTNNLE